MAELLLPQAFLEYFLGHPESAIQENRINWLAHSLDNLVLVHSHPVDPQLRRAVEATWANIILQALHTPSFCQDLQAAIHQVNTGGRHPTGKRCLAEAFLYMHIYRDWWPEPQNQEVIASQGVPLRFDNKFSDRFAFARLSPSGIDFLRQLKIKYDNQTNTYTVRLLANYLLRKNNYPNLTADELPLNPEPSRTQWSRWFDELGLDEKVLPRSRGGRGK